MTAGVVIIVFFSRQSLSCLKLPKVVCLQTSLSDLRCFDTVFQRPYRHFSIVLKVFSSLSDRYEIFISNWGWIEICENVVLGKIDITMTTMKKQKGN